jgi:hypothetical protein
MPLEADHIIPRARVVQQRELIDLLSSGRDNVSPAQSMDMRSDCPAQGQYWHRWKWSGLLP